MKILAINNIYEKFSNENKSNKTNLVKYNNTPDRFVNNQINFQSNENIVQELTSKILENVKNNKNINLKDIFADPTKKTTFLEVLGTLLTTAAAGITNLLTSENNTETIDVPVIKDKDTAQDTNSDKPVEKTKQKKKLENENINKILNPRGRRTKIEASLISFIERDDISVEDKNLLISLYNSLCGYNKSGKQDIHGISIDNSAISQLLYEELVHCNPEKDIPKIHSKFSTQNFTTNDIGMLVNTKEEEPNKTNEITETLSQYNNLNKIYKELIKNDTKGEIIALLDQLVMDIKEINPEISNKVLSKLNQKYSEIFLEIAKINNGLIKEEKQEFFVNISNHNINKDSINDWLKFYTDLSFSFNKFNDLYNADVDNPNAYRTISNLVKNEKIKDFNVKNIMGNTEIELSLPYNASIVENFGTIAEFFTSIKGDDINLQPRKDEYMTKDSIINELKKDFMSTHTDHGYRNIINYLYGYKHNIYRISDFDKHLNENKCEEIVKLLNNDGIFNKQLFDTHSKLRFLERFILNEQIRKPIDIVAMDKVKNLEREIKRNLSEGISIKEYDVYGLNAPQITFITNSLGNVTVTLDKSLKIHTIYMDK